jgi:hypothetical protein
MDLKTLKRLKDLDCAALVENFQRVDHNSATRLALFAAAFSLARVALAPRSARAQRGPPNVRPAQRAACAKGRAAGAGRAAMDLETLKRSKDSDCGSLRAAPLLCAPPAIGRKMAN